MDSWDQWGKHILAELKRLNKNFEDHEALDQTRHEHTIREITALKVKAGMWGAFVSLIVSILGILWKN